VFGIIGVIDGDVCGGMSGTTGVLGNSSLTDEDGLE
jgi:hypothetical protein